MGFLVGLLMLIVTYLLVGPVISAIYVSFSKISKRATRNALFVGLSCAVVYVVIWIVVVCCLEKFVVPCVIGALIALICDICTVYYNSAEIYANHLDEIPTQEKDDVNIGGYLIEIQKRIDSVYAGNVESFSRAEIVEFAISLISFKQKLSAEQYDCVLDRFKEYKKFEEKEEYNLELFIFEITRMQYRFSALINREVLPDGTLGDRMETHEILYGPLVEKKENLYADLEEGKFFCVGTDNEVEAKTFVELLKEDGFVEKTPDWGNMWWLIDAENKCIYHGKKCAEYPRPIGGGMVSVERFLPVYKFIKSIQYRHKK